MRVSEVREVFDRRYSFKITYPVLIHHIQRDSPFLYRRYSSCKLCDLLYSDLDLSRPDLLIASKVVAAEKVKQA